MRYKKMQLIYSCQSSSLIHMHNAKTKHVIMKLALLISLRWNCDNDKRVNTKNERTILLLGNNITSFAKNNSSITVNTLINNYQIMLSKNPQFQYRHTDVSNLETNAGKSVTSNNNPITIIAAIEHTPRYDGQTINE